MIEVIQIAANAVSAKLLGASRETKLMVSEMLSYLVDGAEQNDRFKAGHWDGRSSFFDFRSCIFPAGFVYMVGHELAKLGHKVSYHLKEAPAPLGPDIGSFDPLGYGFKDEYDYQPETVRRLLRHKRIVSQLATGAGKTNVAVLAVTTIARPTLFLTTRSVLAYQMKETFERAGITPGFMGDGIWAPRKGVNIALCQTLAARLARPAADDTSAKAEKQRRRAELTRALLSYFEFVIGEEAHEVGGAEYYEIMAHCRNALYRLALTATPFMRPDGEANMRLQAAFGSIGIQISEKLLIDRGILATPYFKLIDTPAPAHLRRTTRWPTCYDIGIVENAERNGAIAREVVKGVRHSLPVMVLIQREKHGHILNDLFTKAGARSAFISGKHEQEQRQRALSDLANHNLDVLIGSTILDVGVDVPAVGMVGIAGGGKGEIGHRQRIGRGLRKKASGANVSFIFDFTDETNRYTFDHAQTRRSILGDTPGFAENILKKGQEFPYELLTQTTEG